MPVFSPEKPKAAPKAPANEETKSSQPATAPTEASSSAKAGGKTDEVAVSSSSDDFKFPPYLALVRDKIEQNWNPPPGAPGAKAKVEFTVMRSGRVGDAKLQASSGNFYFDQAAVRAILMSSPLPPMPDGFYKEYAVFTVDLQEKE